MKQPKRHSWMRCFLPSGLWSPGVGQRRRHALHQAYFFFPFTLHLQVPWFFPGSLFFFYNLGLSNLKFLLAVSGHSSDCLSNKVPCCSTQKIGVFTCFNFVLSPSRVLLEHSSFTLTNSLFIRLCDYGHSSTFYPISPFFLPLKDPGWLLLYIQR